RRQAGQAGSGSGHPGWVALLSLLWTLGLLVACPAQPLPDRSECADPVAEAAPGQIVGDLLRRNLQAEECVNAGEVTPESGRARGVHDARAAARTAQLERALYV